MIFVPNGASRAETAALLVGTAREFGISQRDIRTSRTGFYISPALEEVLREEGVFETEAEAEAPKAEAPKAEAPETEAPKAEAPKKSVAKKTAKTPAKTPAKKGTTKNSSGNRAAKTATKKE